VTSKSVSLPMRVPRALSASRAGSTLAAARLSAGCSNGGADKGRVLIMRNQSVSAEAVGAADRSSSTSGLNLHIPHSISTSATSSSWPGGVGGSAGRSGAPAAVRAAGNSGDNLDVTLAGYLRSSGRRGKAGHEVEDVAMLSHSAKDASGNGGASRLVGSMLQRCRDLSPMGRVRPRESSSHEDGHEGQEGLGAWALHARQGSMQAGSRRGTGTGTSASHLDLRLQGQRGSGNSDSDMRLPRSREEGAPSLECPVTSQACSAYAQPPDMSPDRLRGAHTYMRCGCARAGALALKMHSSSMVKQHVAACRGMAPLRCRRSLSLSMCLTVPVQVLILIPTHTPLTLFILLLIYSY